MLGLALTLPMILLSGPLGGYLIGWWLIHQFGVDDMVIPVFLILGLIGSGLHAFKLILRLKDSQQPKK